MLRLDEARAAVLAAVRILDAARFAFVEGDITMTELVAAEQAMEVAAAACAAAEEEEHRMHHCRVYSARIGIRDPDALDISRKSAGPDGLPFAPSWDLLGPVLAKRRAGALTPADWDAYVTAYTREMDRSYQAQRAAWDALLARPRVVLTCYCTDPQRCHRAPLRVMLARLGAQDCGELAPPSPPQLALFGRR